MTEIRIIVPGKPVGKGRQGCATLGKVRGLRGLPQVTKEGFVESTKS